MPESLTTNTGRLLAVKQDAENYSDEWYTPPHIFDALGLRFALDPCAPPGGLPWIPAERSYCEADRGLEKPWEGRVWLNPPYSDVGAWTRRLARHGDGIALVFARTDTEWFRHALIRADAVCFIGGRLTFVKGDKTPAAFNSGAPSALLAYGPECAQAIALSELGITFKLYGDFEEVQGELWNDREAA